MRSGLVFALVLMATSSALEGEPPAVLQTGRGDLGAVFESALVRAQRRLATPECRLVLGDFRDPAGTTLAERLNETGLSAPDYLARLEFRDGRDKGLCLPGRVSAFTFVGGSTVWICPGGALAFPRHDWGNGPATLIHEMLHTLGLAENPPTSGEITQRVRERCGL